jgi:hypothetical protein
VPLKQRPSASLQDQVNSLTHELAVKNEQVKHLTQQLEQLEKYKQFFALFKTLATE